MDAIELARHSADRMVAHDEALRALGIEIDIPAPGEAIARLEVTAAMINGFGICHGGFVFTLADTAFAFACNAYGQVTVAAGASIDFLRPAYAGDRLEASACEQHRGRRHGIYDVVVRNQDGRKVAVFRGRAQTTDRPLPGEAGPAGHDAGNDTDRIENPEKT
jgi:acyl-CoA thioesterase